MGVKRGDYFGGAGKMIVKFCDFCGASNPEAKYHGQWKHTLPICDNNVYAYWRDKDICESCSRELGIIINNFVKGKRDKSK